MQKHIKVAALLLSLSAFSVPGLAQNMGEESDFQPYIGTGLGFFGLELNSTVGNFNQTVFGGYVDAGVNVNDYLALELRLGSTASASQTYSTTTFTGSVPLFVSYFAKAKLPVTSDLEFYGLLGGTTAQFKGTNTSGFNQKPSKTGVSYGAGMSYNVQDSLSIGMEWVQYWTNVKLDKTWGTNVKVKFWGAVGTISYHF